MRIALAQLNFTIGDFENNRSLIVNNILKAKLLGADIVVFPELAVSGYPPRDLLHYDHFVERCFETLQSIASVCHEIIAVVGCPVRNKDGSGKKLYNSAAVLENGKILSVINKSLLPNYDVFDEYRYFEPAHLVEVVPVRAGRLAVTICEDLWGLSDSSLYRNNPMDILIAQQPDVIINIAASPFHYRQAIERRKVLVRNAKQYKLPVFYVNHTGGQTELLFDGDSMVVDAHGRIVDQFPCFTEALKLYDTEKLTQLEPPVTDYEETGLIHQALITGIRDYFRKSGFNKAIIGLSGGLDSAVVLALAAEALGNENVMNLLMPSAFSTQHSVSDAVELARRIGSPYEIINIENLYNTFDAELKASFGDTTFGVTEENVQARIRAMLLMAWSNKKGYILLNTSNKSEVAVGYGTLYGDMCGGLSVLGDVYKTQVYALAGHINRAEEIIPESIIKKEPSAELRPGQKDTDSLPAYAVLDAILHAYIEQSLDINAITRIGFPVGLSEQVLRMVNSNEWKRYQMPPALRVSPKAFGSGRRLPIVARYLL